MTPQEQLLLDDFLQRLAAVGGVAKDAQADALIRQRLSGQPDALYLLVQRSLLQQHALDAAKAQIAQLQAQVTSQQGGGSFLGGQQPAWGPVPPAYPPAPQPAAAPSWRERLFGGAPAAPQGGGSSFLSSAATTAAGVAGGMFLFDGIENLLGGHHGGGFGGGGFFGGGQPEVIENVTENNFFDDGNASQGGGQDFASNDFDDVNSDNNFDDDNSGGNFDDDSSWT
ncbi:DUF2076 family protein [Dyella jejuensis]|uniref:DUF2076 family protein n=1 Tax=Dyella jejuensis TaxID=1432009 RepID=A0ABW8JHN8_9GAMM